MISGPELYAVFLVFAAGPALWLAYACWGRRDELAGRWLAVAVVGMAGWSVFWALTILFDSRPLTLGSANMVLLSASVASGAWFMLTLEYTQRKRYPNRYLLVVLLLPLLTQVVAWTNPLHGLLWGPETVVDSQGVLQADQEVWFAVHAVYSFLLTVVSIGLLARSYVRFEGLYRKQTGILLVGVSIPFLSSLVFTAGLIPVSYLNPTPVAFTAGAAIFGWGLYHYRLFEIVPIARRTAYDVMDEAVVTVDERGAIADLNRAARDMFDLSEDVFGTDLADALASSPQVVDAYAAADPPDTITIADGDDYRHLTLDRKDVAHGETTVGTVLVFKDVTELKRHEDELELLKQVFGRVFRHDLSNDLNVIRARGELLADETTDAEQAYAQTVVEKCDDIIETSKKARAIETIVETDRPCHDIEAVGVVERTALWVRDRYPDATVEIEAPEEAWIRADGKTELAIQGLLENGIVHNDDPEPTVRVTVAVDGETVEITVADNGPGINPDEAEILETQKISQLKHSSGLGLWLVYWVVRNSGGAVEFENTDGGATVSLIFDRCGDPDPDPNASAARNNGAR